MLHRPKNAGEGAGGPDSILQRFAKRGFVEVCLPFPPCDTRHSRIESNAPPRQRLCHQLVHSAAPHPAKFARKSLKPPAVSAEPAPKAGPTDVETGVQIVAARPSQPVLVAEASSAKARIRSRGPDIFTRVGELSSGGGHSPEGYR